MKWKEIPEDDNQNARLYMPMDGTTFLAIWKGQFCLASFIEERDLFSIVMLPGMGGIFVEIAKEREGKFTHWTFLVYPYYIEEGILKNVDKD